MPKFHFIYRKRLWNNNEKMYLGWERKRGLLNQFNEYLLQNIKNPFLINTLEEVKLENKLQKIKYIITLDADTELVLNTGLELIGAMEHILNKPVLDENKNIVVEGHALMQPRVGIDLVSCKKSLFSKILSGLPGTDSYTNAISDTYQDNFDEGSFTGKGIYNLNVFSRVLANEFPENLILSHDLLEGCYLRCALVSDIMLLDGFPSKYLSYMARLSRWIRGDFQIVRWLGNKIENKNQEIKQNPLGFFCKYKILDNLFRAITEILIIITTIGLILTKQILNIKIWPIITILFLPIFISSILDILNKIIYKKAGNEKQKTFSNNISSINKIFLTAFINIGSLPYKAYISLVSISKTIYRLLVSKQNLLEWLTAEEAEKQAKTDLKSYYKTMFPNVILGVLAVAYICIFKLKLESIFIFIVSCIWLISPSFFWYLSKDILKINDKISKKDRENILKLGEDTWEYFKDFLTEKYNFLIPDNYQEDRVNKIVERTSSTNIGLSLLAVISAYDLGYITKDETLKLLNSILQTIEKLSKWNGHLYNWYNIVTLEALNPKYISTVDSGNFVAYMYVAKSFFEKEIEKDDKNEKLKIDLSIINKIIENTNFSLLYDYDKRIFSIGFNIEENKLTDSYYDLLASEARTASYIAIAKKDIPYKHWYNLSRTLTCLNKYKGLVSWSGTAFEYLMPNIIMPKYEGSLLDESCRFMIESQKEYCKKLGIPWGISEAAFNIKDLNSNYQYKAFGIPWLGLKRGLADEMVVSSYGSILALTEDTKNVIENIKRLEKLNMYGKYGMYESIDFTNSRLNIKEKYSVVKTYMAHHQALILLSINNYINDEILVKRFKDIPQIEAQDILLQERMPENVIITKEQKEKPEKIKYKDYEEYSQRVYTKVENNLNIANVIANENYSIICDEKQKGYSKYKNILINRFKQTDEEEQGIFFYIKNIKTKRIWSTSRLSFLGKPDKYQICFSEDKNKMTRIDGNMETILETTIGINEPVEIRKLQIQNNGLEDEILEITSFLEPILSSSKQDYAHKAFNNLFLIYEYNPDNGNFIIKRKRRMQNEEDYYLAVNLYTENETIGDIEYEIDKEKFIGKVNLGLPETIESSKPLSSKIGLTIDPILAMKKSLKIPKGKKITLNLLMSVGNDKNEVLENLEKYKSQENIQKTFELSKARVEAENRYLELKGKDIETYQNILAYLIFQNPLKKLYLKNLATKNYSQTELWKYGISGDLPIWLVKIDNQNDIEVLEEILKAYEFYKIKNINIDLVILNEEKYSYESYTKDAIENAISNKHMSYLKNIKGGIFVLYAEDIEDKNLFEFRANLITNAKIGNLGLWLKETEAEYLETLKNIGYDTILPAISEESVLDNQLEEEKLKYYNEYGGFSEDGREYKIRVNKKEKLPTVWSMCLANPNFGTIVTQNMGGYTFSKNSRLNRLTAWSNNSLIDVPSEIIYLVEDKTKKAWSLGFSPMPDDNNYYVTYGFGYAKYEHSNLGIEQVYTVFVPNEDNIKIGILKLKNTKPERKKLKLVYYLKPVLDEDEIESNGYIDLEYNEKTNVIIAKNLYKEILQDEIMYVSSSEKIISYTGSKKTFLGKANITNPDSLKKVSLDNENSLGQDNIIAMQIEIELESFEEKEISLFFGVEQSKTLALDNSYKYSKISKVKEEYENTKKYWENLLQKVQVKTPLESLNIILNGWAVYQTIVSRLWAKSGFYQSGGANRF